MKFHPLHLEYHRLSYKQEQVGEMNKFSDRLTEDFIVSKEHRDLLSQLAPTHGKTVFLLNYCYNEPGTWDKALDHYDTYIFFQYREPISWEWFDIFVSAHKNQKIILVTYASFLKIDPRNKTYDNFDLVQYHPINYRISRALVDYHEDYEFRWPRLCRVSSLCNKPNFFRSLITGYLHKHYSTRSDLLISWNVNMRGTAEYPSVNSLYTTYNRPAIDDIGQYYDTTLKNLSIMQGSPWIDKHYHADNWQNTDAYKTSAINFTNETYSISMQHNTIYPGPFFTDKTRKALLAGCAVIPVGMPGSYAKLEQFGLKFEYPWSKDFDTIEGDLDRIEKLFELIDTVMSYDMDWLQQQLTDSVEFNYHYLRDVGFLNRINALNQDALGNYLRNK